MGMFGAMNPSHPFSRHVQSPKPIASVIAIVRVPKSQFGSSYTQQMFIFANHHSSLRQATSQGGVVVHLAR
jgi:hypothetical protein